MTQSTLNINPSTTNGTQLASLLNNFASAVHSTNLGPTPPAYAEPGMIWCDNSANNYVFKVRKENTWVTLYTITPEGLAEFAGLNKVAYTGKYSDLQNLPYIPTSYGYRNLLINGSFRINQIWGSLINNFPQLSYYVIDGWRYMNKPIETKVSFSREKCSAGELDFISPDLYAPGSQYWFKITTDIDTSLPQNISGLGISQQIDRLRDFGNREMTLSVVAKATTWYGLKYAIYANFGQGGSQRMVVHTGFFEVTNEPGYFSTSFTIGSFADKAFGAGMNLEVSFEIPPRQSNTIYLTCVQLELGNKASAYEIEPSAIELLRCQRFIQKSYAKNVTPGTATEDGAFTMICGQAPAGDSAIDFTYKFATPMATVPGIVIFDDQGNMGKCRVFPGYPELAENNQTCELLFVTEESFQIHKIGRTTSNKGFHGIQLHFIAQSYL